MRMGTMTFPWHCNDRQCGRLPCRRSCYVLGPLADRNHAHHCAIIALKQAGRRAIATARMPMNVKDADKAHVGAWDGDETAQNVAERPR